MNIFDKIKDAAAKNADKVSQGIEKVGDIVDEKTGRKFSGQIDAAQEKAREFLRKNGEN